MCLVEWISRHWHVMSLVDILESFVLGFENCIGSEAKESRSQTGLYGVKHRRVTLDKINDVMSL
jgi:hypothetical protein